jgi:predicted metalloprotease with PDZ domain
MRHPIPLAMVLLLCATAGFAQTPVVYRVSFPAPEHHYAVVDVTFADLGRSMLEARMSRSSPGRYAVHEYSKNVFDVHAYDGKGKELPILRPNPYQWDIAGHDGTVRITYKVFGNLVDGTYLGIDTSHAHMNMPATLMWARRLESRPVRITFEPPSGYKWKPATQLFETSDPWTFTAPNLQYLMDSPTELSDYSLRTFTVRNPDGTEFTIRTSVHHDGTDADVDEYARGTEKIVHEQAAVYGEFPQFDGGTYTFLGDYLPWGGGDGMEHRNSTVVAAPMSIRGNARAALGTVSHEFFHAWNVERIRPRSLEPFNFEEANMSGELWLAEGFTQYYGDIIIARAGLSDPKRAMLNVVNSALDVAVSSGHQFRSAVEMSQMAPFTDAARSIDPTNFSYAFINYYPYGSALALALDFELRTRTKGRLSLDDYMRAMWRVHGKPGGPQPGLVAKPYTLQDARERLAEVSDDRAFADEFFSRYIEGRDVPDYASLLAPAGLMVRKRNPGEGWSGAQVDASGKVMQLVAWGTPAFEAGLEQDDVITTVDGKPFETFKGRKPGDRLALQVTRPTGQSVSLTVTLLEDPTLESLAVEDGGGTLSAAQKAFRESWLGSKARVEAGAVR